MQSKVNSLKRAGDLNNALLTEIRDIHEHCIPLTVSYLKSP